MMIINYTIINFGEGGGEPQKPSPVYVPARKNNIFNNVNRFLFLETKSVLLLNNK